MNGTGLSGGDPTLLRRLNVEAVLRVLRNAEPMTLTRIARAAALSRQTVDVVIAELDAAGWIEEVAPERSVGRPARRYRFRAEAGHVLGVDVGVTGVRMQLADLDGTVLASGRAELPPGMSGPGRLDRIRDAAVEFLAGRKRVRLRGVCLGVPAIVDAHGAVRLSTPIPEWNGVDVADAASTWFDCPAYVENDANLAALAEHWRGVARYADDFIQLIAGKRSGAGMMLGGRLHRGRGGAAGEIGALAVLGWEGDAVNEVRTAPDAARLFADAEAGEPEAVARVDHFARILAQGIAAMVLTVNPDLVVIGGGLSRAGEALAGPVRNHMEQLCLDPPQVATSALGVEAVTLGAVRLALEHVNLQLFGSHGLAGAGAVPAGDGGRVGRRLNRGVFEPPVPGGGEG
ncbi:ROK family transcriptional regulator [Streptomyces globisporus]|uniref:ROK family transcriptional regulator n=1 Tax=Streptomyces globisporus TaxID=1908 RepID=UPI00068C8342|nr:ROK family transcriptional regulator [Streptomyces globisporus]